MIAGFIAHGWEFEIFGSTAPVERQPGWRHLEVEQRLLALGGPSFRATVMKLRQAGLKTEPAFWSALNQSGAPYSGMLSLSVQSDDVLAEHLQNGDFTAEHTSSRG
ncbi:DUF4269 domain-containing protein [Rhizobium sp. UBA1881]|uniref:DUF4269 domain-containing protein n=1 Tax=Rhizobium sp. UBA1881 TaxID=1947375 RepID=UPI0032E4BECA